MHIIKGSNLFIILFLVIGCSQESNEPTSVSDALEPNRILTDSYYQSAAETILKLNVVAELFARSVVAFTTQPDQNNLQACRQAWLLLHKIFIELDFYFHAELRRDEVRSLVFNIHAWPLEPGFIDSLPEYPTSGIINDLTLELSKTSLQQQHGITSVEEICLGLHAAEYLLWQRSLSDFQPVSELHDEQVADGIALQQLSNNRRRRVLELISDNLEEDLISLGSFLAPDQKINRGDVVNDPLYAIQQALKGSQNELLQISSVDRQNHSEFSRSSLQDILSRLEIINRSYSIDTNLSTALPLLNRQQATEFSQALAKTLLEIKILRPSDSAGIARLKTLIAMLEHHIGEFVALLANQTRHKFHD